MDNSRQNLHKNKIAIVGNPNVGKSTLFNQITTSYSLEANAPYTTVSVQRAPVVVDGVTYEIVDMPGIVSLDVQSEDGLVARNILLQEHPEVIILCMDTNNMQRSLLLLAQVIELDIPLLICLNFLDESRRKGIEISCEDLAALTGVPVIETDAPEGCGVKDLLKAIPRAAVSDTARIGYKPFIEEGLDALSGCFPQDTVPPDGVLMLLLLKDREVQKYVKARYGAATLKKAGKPLSRCAGMPKEIFPALCLRSETGGPKTFLGVF